MYKSHPQMVKRAKPDKTDIYGYPWRDLAVG